MILDYAENIVQLLANITALLLCLFQYISSQKKGWLYATFIFLAGLMSSYYWTAYLIVMGDTPNVSSLISDSGWNIAFFILLLLVLYMRDEGARHYFHPLMLLPVPVGLVQLAMYLPFGSLFLNLYQVGILTVIAVFCLQSILWYCKNKRTGARPPYVAIAVLMFVICEFGMWISSWLVGPYPDQLAFISFLSKLSNLYYLFSFACSFSYFCIVWALFLTYKSEQDKRTSVIDAKNQIIFKIGYFAALLVCCLGGILLATWMRDTMMVGLNQNAESEIYTIIPVILFVITLFLDAFAILILFVVTLIEKVAENHALREARTAAEHSNAAKSEFLANMSHEIRTPINAVLGMNEMILRESIQAYNQPPQNYEDTLRTFADIHNYAGNIQSAGNNLLSIINDILDFSKIEAGRLDIVDSNYKLGSVLNDVSNMIAFKAREKGLDFRVNVDPFLPDSLCGDEVRVRQIILNLLSNAVKYTEKGGVWLSVRGEEGKTSAVGERVCLTITVKDTGIGIRPGDIDRIYEKFERMDLKRNSTVEGTGLGLAITRRLLDMMGGNIDVESEYGKGSTFTVTFTQKVISTETVGDFEEKFARSVEETKVYRESFYAPDARILAVDDTRMNLAVIVNLLKNTGIRIDTAVSGEEAIGLCRTISYDLILMDQRMPEMDGTEAMCVIREQEDGANKNTPFICMTADAVSGARERYLAEGFTDYLAKPIESRQLEQMLLKYLPVNKVIPIREDGDAIRKEKPITEMAEYTGMPNDPFSTLRQAGIDTEAGLGYCDGDKDMYGMMLGEYAKNAEEKTRELEKCFEEQNWHRYAVSVHALKSTSAMIGATELSKTAAEMEAAADTGKADTIRKMHADMLSRYAEIVKAIVRTVGNSNGSVEKPAADDEILEFQPEDEEGLEFQPGNKEILEYRPGNEEVLEFRPGNEEVLEFQSQED